MLNLNQFLPVVSKKNLLLVASATWSFAGIMLLTRGEIMYFAQGETYDIKILISIVTGVLFYFAIFRKVSDKHIQRILNLENESVPFYQFFDKRSYLLMALMITLGIMVRISGIVPLDELALFYITMGTPLVISALKFLNKRLLLQSEVK